MPSFPRLALRHPGRALVLPLLVALPLLTPALRAHEPTLEQRLARICEDLDQRRQDLHISGLSLAIVKDDQLLLARGFGLRDREKKIPCDEKTRYGIGSTSKAFTSMVAAMLADEGKLAFTDRPSKFLPWFKFKDPVADSKATLRDLLVHRTGLTRTDLAWFATPATREQLLRQIAVTEPNRKFAGEWQYNNAMFLCVGECEAAVAGKTWDDLVHERIFRPLGMQQSGTAAVEAFADPNLSKGYDWDGKKNDFGATPFINIDNIGPAGSITSTVADMANWVRFLLNRGTFEGKRLVADAQFDELWKDDDELPPSYGPGWFLHASDGRDGQAWKAPDGTYHRVIEHGGNITGYAAEVGLLPDQHLGLVLLTNTSATQLQQSILSMVWNGLLGPWVERREVKEGTPLPDDLTTKWLGSYYDLERRELPVRSLTRSTDHLSLVLPPTAGQQSPIVFTLLWPDGADSAASAAAAPIRFALKEDPQGHLTVERDDKGVVRWLELVYNGMEPRTLKPMGPPPAPRTPDLNVDELMEKRAEAQNSAVTHGWKTLRMTGRFQVPSSGINAKLTLLAAGTDRLRVEWDANPFGYFVIVVNGERGWMESNMSGLVEAEPADAAVLGFANPLVESGNWLDHAQDVELVTITSTAEIGASPGTLAYAARITPYAGDPFMLFVSVDKFLPVAVQGRTAFFGMPNAAPLALLSDVRDVQGFKIPFRREFTAPQVGRLTVVFEKAEVDVELPADAFTLREVPKKKEAAGS